jgi:hypothetical protein
MLHRAVQRLLHDAAVTIALVAWRNASSPVIDWVDDGADCVCWWRRRESNPGPQAFELSVYGT